MVLNREGKIKKKIRFYFRNLKIKKNQREHQKRKKI